MQKKDHLNSVLCLRFSVVFTFIRRDIALIKAVKQIEKSTATGLD